MFKSIIEFLKDLFKSPTMFDQLEAHIIAGNPQTAADVEQLERGFYDKHQRQVLWHFKE